MKCIKSCVQGLKVTVALHVLWFQTIKHSTQPGVWHKWIYMDLYFPIIWLISTSNGLHCIYTWPMHHFTVTQHGCGHSTLLCNHFEYGICSKILERTFAVMIHFFFSFALYLHCTVVFLLQCWIITLGIAHAEKSGYTGDQSLNNWSADTGLLFCLILSFEETGSVWRKRA